jgi:hypothetical protein
MLRLAFVAALCALSSAQTAAPLAPWWTREPLRIVHIVTSLGSIDCISPAERAGWIAAQSYGAEHFEVMEMHGGLDDQGFSFQSPAAGRINRDYLREYAAQARRRGTRIIVYFNVHWYTGKFGASHPDWRQVRENGRPLDGVYDNGTDFCLNTPWREWCFHILRDLASYPIDGIFYDGPVFRAIPATAPTAARSSAPPTARTYPPSACARAPPSKASSIPKPRAWPASCANPAPSSAPSTLPSPST